MTAWTTPDDVAARLRRRWDDGSLLRAYVRGEPFPRLEVPVRGPSPGQIGADLARVREWNAALVRAGRDGRAYELTRRAVGGRAVGRNTLPARVEVRTYEQAWRLLAATSDVAALDEVLALTRAVEPRLVDWVADNALRVLALSADWPRILAAATWLAAHAGRGYYLRQIGAEGVDTKLVGRHRLVLAALLDVLLPPERVRPEHSRGDGFAERYGFLAPPRLLRMRCHAGFAELPTATSEVALRLEEAARLDVSVQHVMVVENEVTYLAAPVPSEGVVVWGAGYAAGRLGRVPWVRAAPRVTYSGDIDSHGFAILSLLRGQVPQTASLLMDRETLLAHRERWGQETPPTRARLDHLTGPEQALYQDLVEDVYAPALRLEQERLGWDWVEQAMAAQAAAQEAARAAAQEPAQEECRTAALARNPPT